MQVLCELTLTLTVCFPTDFSHLHSQVYRCLQPLMLCLSHQGTLNAIDELNTLMSSLDPLLTEVNIQSLLHACMCICLNIYSVSITSDYMQAPTIVPTGFSSSTLTLDDSFTSMHSVPLDLSAEEIEPSDTEDSGSGGVSGTDDEDNDELTVDEEESEMEVESTTMSACVKPPAWSGYVIEGDNVDKNIHQSFQRVDCKTQSLHYFNAYAVLDRIDFSGLSDEVPCTAVDPSTFCQRWMTPVPWSWNFRC